MSAVGQNKWLMVIYGVIKWEEGKAIKTIADSECKRISPNFADALVPLDKALLPLKALGSWRRLSQTSCKSQAKEIRGN